MDWLFGCISFPKWGSFCFAFQSRGTLGQADSFWRIWEGASRCRRRSWEWSQWSVITRLSPISANFHQTRANFCLKASTFSSKHPILLTSGSFYESRPKEPTLMIFVTKIYLLCKVQVNSYKHQWPASQIYTKDGQMEDSTNADSWSK